MIPLIYSCPRNLSATPTDQGGARTMSSPTEDSSGQDTFGPSLPPTTKDRCNDEFGPSLPKDMIGPSLPKSDAFGPSLPKDMIGPSLPKDMIGPSLPKDMIGPSLPKDMIGPSLPKDMIGPSSDTFGPSLPPGHTYGQGDALGPLPPDESGHTISSSPSLNQEDDVVGPLPPQPNASLDEESEKSKRKQEIEVRANQMRSKLDSKNIPVQPVREEWMLELPPEINPNATALSMTSRKFRTKYSETGDRSIWTDTPAEKARKAAEERQKIKKEEEEIDSISKRDQKLAEEIEQYNKRNRGESLVDLHRKRKAEELQGSSSDTNKHMRRPFDRDIDLQLPQNIMTETKRKSLIKDSAKSLDSKFAHGKSHFL